MLVFAAFLFSIKKIPIEKELIESCIAFILFCITSGVVYILNDYADIKQDQAHPEKKFRPMASGAIKPKTALSIGLILVIAEFMYALNFNFEFGLLLIGYFFLNILYSVKLKHVVIIDIMIIASGFVIRAIAGAIAIHVPFTPWFLLCTMLLALFLAISKRRYELVLLQDDKGSHRKVLEFYSTQLLDQFISIVTTATIMTYSLYTFFADPTGYLMWTIPLVIYGIFRYLYIIYMEGKGGRPELLLLQDKHIAATVILYSTAVIVIIWNS
jgi:4-hydroxybenzoate polyprenyltransferase